MVTIPKTHCAPPLSEAQTVVMNWVQATEEFHRRYYKVNEAINALYPGKRPTASMLAQDKIRAAKLTNLLRIRQRMNDTLSTLLGDMSEGKPNRHQSLSKPGQLVIHTRLLLELTRDIDQEIGRVIGAQA